MRLTSKMTSEIDEIRQDIETLTANRLTDHAMLSALLQASSIALVNRVGVIIWAGYCAERLFGFEAGGMVGVCVDSLVPERFREYHRGEVKKFFDRPVSRTIDLSSKLFPALRADGTEFKIHIGFTPVIVEGNPIVVVTFLEPIVLDEQE